MAEIFGRERKFCIDFPLNKCDNRYMKELIIESKTHGTQTILLDDEDYELVTNVHWSWYIRRFKYKDKEKWYGEAKMGPNKAKKFRKLYPDHHLPPSGCLMMHKFIMNTPKGMHTDHLNHDGLDNRKKNLRICTASQNSQNKRLREDSRSGYKGVYTRPNGGKFQAYIGDPNTRTPRKRQIKLGSYETAEEAARVYDKAAKELFGEFAYFNFPNEVA